MTSPGVQKPHCTAPGVDERPLHVGRRAGLGEALDGDDRLSTALAASTRHEHTSSPSTSTLHEPHSPCSHAPLAPSRPSRSRSTYSRLSPSHASATSWRPPLTWSV